jgi:hypothetical protein
LLRSLFRQSFSFYGYHYLRYLIQVLRIDTSLFAHGVTLAVRGHHFIRITREILRADAFTSMIHETLAALHREVEIVASARSKIRREDVEARVKAFLRPVRRAYRGLGRGVRTIVGEAFMDFERRCQLLVQRTGLSYS